MVANLAESTPSAPTLIAEMAAKYGVPVYPNDSPITPMWPAWSRRNRRTRYLVRLDDWLNWAMKSKTMKRSWMSNSKNADLKALIAWQKGITKTIYRSKIEIIDLSLQSYGNNWRSRKTNQKKSLQEKEAGCSPKHSRMNLSWSRNAALMLTACKLFQWNSHWAVSNLERLHERKATTHVAGPTYLDNSFICIRKSFPRKSHMNWIVRTDRKHFNIFLIFPIKYIRIVGKEKKFHPTFWIFPMAIHFGCIS